jgi:hypothetical protein
LALTLGASRGFSPGQHYVQSQMLDKQEVSGSIPLRPTKMMARYRVSEGHRQSHSGRVQVEVPTVPRPTFAVGEEVRVLATYEPVCAAVSVKVVGVKVGVVEMVDPLVAWSLSAPLRSVFPSGVA